MRHFHLEHGAEGEEEDSDELGRVGDVVGVCQMDSSQLEQYTIWALYVPLLRMSRTYSVV